MTIFSEKNERKEQNRTLNFHVQKLVLYYFMKLVVQPGQNIEISRPASVHLLNNVTLYIIIK